MALANRLRHLVDIKRPFWNQNYIGSAGDAAIQCNPARIATHHLNHDHAIVSFGGGMDAVNCFTHYVAGRIETEGVVGSTQIIVDGLGDANHLDPGLVQFLGDR